MIRAKVCCFLMLSLSLGLLLFLPFLLTQPESCSIEQAAADEYMWYYLPHELNQQPKPMEKAPYITKYNVIYIGDKKENTIYLTFDDCPENDNIPAILDTLKKNDAVATFFMTEAYIRQHPDVINRIIKEDSMIGNHTAKHVGVSRLGFDDFKAQLQSVEDAYYQATGKELPKYFRPPQGLFSEQSLKFADELGYTTVFWSFRYSDWDVGHQPSNDNGYKTIMSETHPGEIVLLHCQSKTNVSILDSILKAWEKQGYSFGLISDIKSKKE